MTSPKVYPALASCRILVKGTMQTAKITGDRLSPWKIPRLTSTIPSVSPQDVSSVFQFTMDFWYLCSCAFFCNQQGPSYQSTTDLFCLYSFSYTPSVLQAKHRFLQRTHTYYQLWSLSSVSKQVVDRKWVDSYQQHYLFLGRSDTAQSSSSELFFTRHLPEFIGNMPTPTTTRAFVGYLPFSRGKGRVSIFTQKPFRSKNILKPTLDMKQQVFPRNELKIIIKKSNSRSE